MKTPCGGRRHLPTAGWWPIRASVVDLGNVFDNEVVDLAVVGIEIVMLAIGKIAEGILEVEVSIALVPEFTSDADSDSDSVRI